MVEYRWPELARASLLGKRISRLDGPVKVTGVAEYASDKSFPGMLHATLLFAPHAHARITKLDVSAAKAIDGVRAVHVIQDVGAEIQWAHDEIVAVAAETEAIARDAVAKVVVEYEVLEHFVDERDLDAAPSKKEPTERIEGDPEAALERADIVIERQLGMPQIAHLCLEPHGQVARWVGDELEVYASTQAVSTLPFQFAEALDIPATKVRVFTDYMGGGFGSKFGPDRWGIVCAQLARQTGAPVRLFLDREMEVAVAGSRPSAWSKVRAGVTKAGEFTGWASDSWGSGGAPGTSEIPVPYVFEIPDRSNRHVSVSTNFAGSRAWRAPNHPQACFVTMTVLDDLAHELGRDPLDVFLQNLGLTQRADTYREELEIAAEMMQWRERFKPRDERDPGPLQRGLGLSIHTWGGRGHQSNCEVAVFPDGSVEARLGTQDLGTGTRTVVAVVLAETFGLPLEAVSVKMGDSALPQSGPSGGSSTVGGVSASTRRASQNALAKLFEIVAPELGVTEEELVAAEERIFVAADPEKGIAFRDAARLLGVQTLTATGRNPGRGKLIDSGVGGVQMADVTVDIETGVVELNRMVAVQDCGLVVDHKLAESQVHGGLIMGIGYALFEERIVDPKSGRLLNPDMEFYQLAGLFDVGTLDVHLMTGPGYDDRGVIGIGEPPVISPGAAISNAVANAIGVRVPSLPITPDRVLAALAEA